MPKLPASTSSERSLCLDCGLCCSGVLFDDVRLQAGDDAPALKTAGLPVRRRGAVARFSQPCAALRADGGCSVYEKRPAMCRQFECGVLKQVSAGVIDRTQALRLIRRARKLAATVGQFLDASGNHRSELPLAKRFQEVMRQPIDLADEGASDRRGQLMRATQRLMDLLHSRFLSHQ